MIKTWTDSSGVTHYADEHSKAYRGRDEATPEGVTSDEKPVKRAVTVKTDPAN